MVRAKHTRPKRSEQMSPQLEKGDVRKYLSHALEGFHLPPIDTSDIEQVKERCDWYFNHCVENDVRPSMAGLCNAITVSKRLGHKQVSTTENIYAHLISKAEAEAAETVATVLFQKKA